MATFFLWPFPQYDVYERAKRAINECIKPDAVKLIQHVIKKGTSNVKESGYFILCPETADRQLDVFVYQNAKIYYSKGYKDSIKTALQLEFTVPASVKEKFGDYHSDTQAKSTTFMRRSPRFYADIKTTSTSNSSDPNVGETAEPAVGRKHQKREVGETAEPAVGRKHQKREVNWQDLATTSENSSSSTAFQISRAGHKQLVDEKQKIIRKSTKSIIAYKEQILKEKVKIVEAKLAIETSEQNLRALLI